jgi:hypothetical protein
VRIHLEGFPGEGKLHRPIRYAPAAELFREQVSGLGQGSLPFLSGGTSFNGTILLKFAVDDDGIVSFKRTT